MITSARFQNMPPLFLARILDVFSSSTGLPLVLEVLEILEFLEMSWILIFCPGSPGKLGNIRFCPGKRPLHNFLSWIFSICFRSICKRIIKCNQFAMNFAICFACPIYLFTGLMWELLFIEMSGLTQYWQKK